MAKNNRKVKVKKDKINRKIMAKKDKIEFFVFLTLLFILFIFLIIYFSSKNKKNIFKNILNSIESDRRAKLLPTVTSTPTPRAIPHGKIPFTVGQSDKTVPQFRKGDIDPYDPGQGATQTVTINVRHPVSVKTVSAMLITDHAKSMSVPFKLVSGTDTNGEWKGTWAISDTYFYKYQLVLNAEGSDGKIASVVVTLR